jgi:gamma-glutamyl hercynylcysteine S-oxide hydrolase
MCRHMVYIGPPVPLSALLLEPPHGLLHQSWAPQDMRGGGTINADGFGVGWYAGGGPVRYRRASPIWSDDGFAELAGGTYASAVLAVVRSATVGMPVTEAACAPFATDGWLFSHNGLVAGWPDSVAKLAEQVPVVDLLTLDASTDSALLWALVRHRLRGGVAPATALRHVVAEVGAAAPGSRLNLLLFNGHHAYATTAGHSLWTRQTPEGLVIASEPFDDRAGWEPVPDRHLVIADRSTHTVEEL